VFARLVHDPSAVAEHEAPEADDTEQHEASAKIAAVAKE